MAETRSHILMGQFHVERYVQQKVEIELAKKLCAETKRDYIFFLEEAARFALDIAEEEIGEVAVSADIGLLPAWAVALLFIREFVVTGIRSAFEQRAPFAVLSVRGTVSGSARRLAPRPCHPP